MNPLKALSRGLNAMINPSPLQGARNYTGYHYGGYGFGLPELGNADISRDSQGLALAMGASVWAYKAISARSQMLAATPMQIKSKSGKVIADSRDRWNLHPLFEAMQRARRESGVNFIAQWEASRCIWGETYIEKVTNRYGYDRDIRWLNPAAITREDWTGRLEAIQYMGANDYVRLKRDEFVHDRMFNSANDLMGLSPLEVALNAVNIDRNKHRTIKAFFANNMVLGPTISPKPSEDGGSLGDDQWAQLLQLLRERHRGTDNAFRPLALDFAADIVYPRPADPTYVTDIGEHNIKEILSAFGVQKPLIGDIDSSHYQASPEILSWFYRITLGPEFYAIEEVINDDLMPIYDRTGRYRMEFDRSEYDIVTDADIKQQQAIKADYEGGIITFNEAREKRGYESVENGDFYVVPAGVQIVPAEQLGQPIVKSGNEPQIMIQRAAPAPMLPPGNTSRGVPTRKPQSYAVLGYADDNRRIKALQDVIRGIIGAQAEYNDPDTFHITLVYSEDAHFEDIFDTVAKAGTEAFAITIDGVGVFDTPDGYAIHLTIREGPWVGFQRQMVSIAKLHDVELSPYTIDYNPHITLAYSTVPIEPFDLDPFTLLVNRIEVSDSAHDKIVVQHLRAAPADDIQLSQLEDIGKRFNLSLPEVLTHWERFAHVSV